MSPRVLKRVNLITNNTCIFDHTGGLPPRVGVPVEVRTLAFDGIRCNKTSTGGKSCCCLPIASTWHLNCDDARAWLKQKNYLDANGNGPNQKCAGGVGSQTRSLVCSGARLSYM